MFDFEKLDVCQKSKLFNKIVFSLLKDTFIDKVIKDQLRRASFSVMLNIAEGSSRFSNADRRHFLVIARGSAFECVAIFDFLKDESMLNEEMHSDLYLKAEELSKMLFSMIKKLS